MEDKAAQTDFPVPPQFLNEYELYMVETRWSQCESLKEFCHLAKLPHWVIESLEMDIKSSGMHWKDYIKDRSHTFVGAVQVLLKQEGLQYGIWWPRLFPLPLNGDPDIGRTVKAFVELIKVSQLPGPDYTRFGDYWAIMRRVLPSTTARIQTRYDPRDPNRRMDGWWTGA